MRNYLVDQRTITFLISLLIATILWFLIKLSGDFQTDQSVKLNFQNLPQDKILINKPDSTILIRTKNNGFDLLGQKLFNRIKPLNVDFAKAKFLHSESGIQSYFILSSSIMQQIETEFNSAEQILSVKPDSILFSFEKLASKKLKVELQLRLNFNPRYKQYQQMQFNPESILIYGPASALDTINSIKTQELSLLNISSNIDTTIKIILPGKELKTEQDKIRLKLSVEEYTEGKITLPIQLDASAKVHYKVFPSEAQVTYQVALKDYSKINPNAFELRATPDSIEAGKLRLHLSKQPKNIILSNIQPATAEYIILK